MSTAYKALLDKTKSHFTNTEYYLMHSHTTTVFSQICMFFLDFRISSKISLRGFIHLRECLTSKTKKPCLLKEERKEKNRSDLKWNFFSYRNKRKWDVSCWLMLTFGDRYASSWHIYQSMLIYYNLEGEVIGIESTNDKEMLWDQKGVIFYLKIK